ncbi:Gfo/Idh/MocA family oxidoreductase [Mesorhizobium sp. WSM4307]|uniref:Gfo/Idh/MocA family protein n=1 Tax=unclassified Mesorhizobium TaxID=325217 RepID=UPI000BAE9D85|nr:MULTISPECIES: Gfo/Idh/MocA family oxidoreductase [unclassified Mesorhizobium]PBB24407.1 1-carboxy-3-chloro-3,4-dihydroxycyclo hexa-1,5-diene dehydrogenase [Mesorhizobium sp. WSM4304]PBB74625.1 1-carboxy-3-chloro-3,4-dihydroxycyclo hexa-1,5-diene dehydrogenase [Mesorhizobium sp. WSM4308]TRC73207.1 Gfo/Idh/MocA family oxidoreductase [Mesorhizobium sp. WSM4315]TRC83485.1 Gfo/Idh/MocA family oxidoreductase [Mesorhizobium sp. WSM4307]
MRLGLGLIGSGFMGRTHAFGFTAVNHVFDLPIKVDRVVLADVDGDRARDAAAALGFLGYTGNWRELMTMGDVHIVDITAPNILHKEMALAAIAAGKHVYCEKPLAPSASEALEMTLAAEAAGVVTAVGFNYLKNPMLKLAKEIIESGEIGEVRSFNGIHAEDYMADAQAPWTWRLDPAGGGGALADLGSHVVATARYLVGPIAQVLGDLRTVITERPVAPGSKTQRKVEVEDIGRAFVRFENGATGCIQANWIETGRKMQHDFAISGSRGGIAFSQERFNELDLYLTSDVQGRSGFRKIFAGPAHEPYGAFCVAPGHQIGFNDLKTIEVCDFLRAVSGEKVGHAGFREGLEVQRTVEAIYRSAKAGTWRDVE